MAKGLQLGSGSSLRCSDQVVLGEAVQAAGGPRPWLDMLDREHGYILALARVLADGQRMRKEDAEQAMLG